MKVTEKTFESTGGLNTLKGVLYEPDGEIRAAVQIVHGVREHIGRYAPLMEALCEAGFAVFGHNHIGHKGSSEDGDLGFFGYDHGFRTLINDVNAFGDALSEDCPGVKRFLYGHGMGSSIARLAVLDRPGRFSGLILSGAAGPDFKGAGIAACNAVTFAKGGKFKSQYLEKRAFANYDARFGGENRWLSSLDGEVRAYNDDKHCGFPLTACGMYDYTKLGRVCNKKIWSEAVSETLPIYLISGEDDPESGGVKTVCERLEKAGRDVRMKLYPAARHDIHNDVCRDQVISDVVKFIEERI